MRLRNLLCFVVMSLAVVGPLSTNAAGADAPWTGPAFTGNPAEIIKAAGAVESEKGFDVTVLLDERSVSVDAEGTTREQFHVVYRVDSNAGVKSWGSTGLRWEPWHQNQPEIHARVITSDAVEHMLDPKTLSDTPAREDSSQVYSDTRLYRGPLPAVATGSVVEVQISLQDTSPAIPGGIIRRYFIARRVPVRQVRILLEAPSSVMLRYEVRLLPAATVVKTSASGITRIKIDNGPLAPIEQTEPNVPSEVVNWPQVEFSTVPSWQKAASAYQQMTDPQIRVDDVRLLVGQTISASDPRTDKIRKLTAKLHQLVRYTGVEFGESSLVPQPPSEVLQRKYGDCKDKAATLVAMLRASGIDAYLALLRAGDGQDVSPSLPGDNLFNHAIVFVPGKPDIWIDATDEFSPPGQLAPSDQGKQALVIRDGSASPVQTPISAPADNLLLETREFHLAEFGPARVVESSESHGDIDRRYRAYYGTDRDSKKVEKEMENYVKSAYLSEEPPRAERGDGKNLREPFLFRIEAVKAKRGWTSLHDARMAVLLSGIVGRLPDYFKKNDEDLAKERAKIEKPLPPRSIDYALPAGFITEWRYKIIAPPGFKLRAVPDNRTQDLGPAKLSQQYSVDPDGIVDATFRFDTVKSRYTAAEGEALRKAVVELRKSNAIVVAFDQVGYALLSAGKAREAIAAFDGLVKVHPTEALHHVQIADGLLEAGLGEAARTEANEAVRLEPSSALAHKTYGWILEHDLIGRRFKKGCDLTAAAVQYRKSLDLDPDDDDARIDFAILLEYDSDGERYSDKADIRGAVEQYRELKKRKSTWKALDNNLLFALFYSRQFKDVEEVAMQLEPDATRIALVVASRAAIQGSEAGLKKSFELTSDEKARMEALTTAANRLLNLRYYKQAADLLSKVNTGDSSLELINALATTQPHESLVTSEKDPIAFVQKMLTLVVGPDSPDPRAVDMFAKAPAAKKKGALQEEEVTVDSLRGLANYIRNTAVADLAQEARGDVFLSNMKTSAEGGDTTGYRVTVRCLGLSDLSLYVSKDGEQYHILPVGEIRFMGRTALAKLQKGDVAAARKWLDWAREEQNVSGGDDPLDGPIFPRLWRKGQNGDKSTVERAVAILLIDSDEIAPLLPALVTGREQAADDTQRAAYGLALSSAYATLQRWNEARSASERLLRTSLDSPTAFKSFVSACAELKDWKAIENAAKARLDRSPEDADAIEVLSDAAERQGKIDKSLNILRDALKKGEPRASLLNNYAWNALFLENLPNDAIETAQRAARLTENKNFGVTHTLASVYAEVGRVGEARQLLIQAMDQSGMDEPNSAVWYVFGRIAEQYGRWNAALTTYRKVEKDSEGEPRPNSTYMLAQRAIRRMANTKNQ
jgi:tetratricopeptide (TPR) repeat protein/transglutaminase-like putative cysteine protease